MALRNCNRITVAVIVLMASLFICSPRAYSVSIILTSDQQLRDLLDPDKQIDLSMGLTKRFASLREICESASERGDNLLTIAFDEFFRQYRAQAGTERRLTPDMDEYIDMIKVISDFAAGYGMGIGLSLNSPLELGPAYKNATGESGRWLHYKIGHRDPTTGKFSIPIWQQLSWTNNKGKFVIDMKNVRAFAYKESRVDASPFRAVSPDDIIELQGVSYQALDTVFTVPVNEMWVDFGDEEGTQDMGFETRNLRVYYDGPEQLPGYNRVMVLLEYETPEMDYFSPHALPFLQELMKKYHDKGINLVSLYSDEMHLQQDWYYFDHHENGQFAVRYLTPHFSNRYKERFGQELEDKHMLYFVYGAPTFESSAHSVRNMQYVMGSSPEDIHRTFLLRDRYYKMLNNDVVDLFLDSKSYAESLFGRTLEAYGHASWAESPTIDLWDTEKLFENAAKYEYTSNYIWGNTVQQAAAACYDYFKWGEYLEPTGNDFAECGWLDRNYYGAAMAASIGVINKYPNAYAAAWGMPQESREWRLAINTGGFGAFGRRPRLTNNITGRVHRDIEVLILYPMNLVAVEERFGSWMTQYAYANYLTAEKLMELGEITENGLIRVADQEYNTLVAIFEPLPHEGLLSFMESFAGKGGNLLWFGPPPLLDGSGLNCTAQWQQLFGAEYIHDQYMGEIAAGRKVDFRGAFSHIPKQTVLTDFAVDRFYPVKPAASTQILAGSGDRVLGTHRNHGKGNAYFFGFRPRDDQSASLGYETRTLFEILNATGAYKGSGKFAGVNDNPTYLSRTTDYFVGSFPNNSVVVVKHYRTHAESWQGGFSRDLEADRIALEKNPLPCDSIIIYNKKINGHEVSYSGKMLMAFRKNEQGQLIAFEGTNCKAITIDGKQYTFSSEPMERVVFYPDLENPSNYEVIVQGKGTVKIPVPLDTQKTLNIYTSDNETVPYRIIEGNVEINLTPSISGRSLQFVQM